MRIRKWLSALLVMALLALPVAPATAELTPRQMNNLALKSAVLYLQNEFPAAEKAKHRVLILDGGERLVLINLRQNEELIHCCLLLSEDYDVRWAAAENQLYHLEQQEYTLFYISKSGECYHDSITCSSMKDPLALPDFAAPLLDGVLRTCKNCKPQYAADTTD